MHDDDQGHDALRHYAYLKGLKGPKVLLYSHDGSPEICVNLLKKRFYYTQSDSLLLATS